MAKRKMIWIPKTGKIETITINDDLDSVCSKIGCDLIDMTAVGESSDGSLSYDFICDDEGMLVADSMEDHNLNSFSIAPYRLGIFRQPLFGNLLMCAIDNETGEYADMNVTEAKRILKELYML